VSTPSDTRLEHGASPIEDRLGALVDELLELAAGIVPAIARLDLEEGRHRLREEHVNLVVLGEFKRGKSTLVNALVDSDVLPTGVVPLTAAVTVVRHGQRPRLVVVFTDGAHTEVALAQIAEFATEAGNPGNRRGVQLLRVELPAPVLAQGVQLVDTPGIGSVFVRNSETALGFLGRVDAALFTLAADQPLSAAEEQLIRNVSERVPRIFFALNKIDHLGAKEREQAVAFVREGLHAVVGATPDIYPLSARTREGLEPLRRRLALFADHERKDVLVRSVRSLAVAFAAEALQAVRFEAHAVVLPLNELEQKQAKFRERSVELRRAHEEAALLLHQSGAALASETVNEPLLLLAKREAPALVEQLRGFAADEGHPAPRALAARLDAWIDRTIRERFTLLGQDYEERIARCLSELHERYAGRVERVLRDLDDATAELFGARAGRRAPRVGLRGPSRFSFKLHDLEREPLDQLASLASASRPGAVGRRLVLRQAEKRLCLQLDRHAGRLRSDLADRIETSVREYERDLGFVVREAIDSIDAAVERASRKQQSGRLHVSERREDLARTELRLSQLEVLLAGGEPSRSRRPSVPAQQSG
jgi:small GTP-binding protein